MSDEKLSPVSAERVTDQPLAEKRLAEICAEARAAYYGNSESEQRRVLLRIIRMSSAWAELEPDGDWKSRPDGGPA